MTVFIEQLRNALALFLVESGNKTFPKALLRPVADASDKALQNAHARQHHLVHDQPRRSPLDQGTGVIVATPAQRVKPSGQAKPGRSIVSKLGKAITLSDQGEMPNALAIFMIEITLEAWRGLQAELADQESRYGTGNSKIILSRTTDGRLAAKARGVAFGRPRKMRPDQQELARELVREGKSISAVARTFDVHPATIYRIIEG